MGSPSMLLDLRVEHDYFPNRACLCLEFRPDEQTASELASRRIPVRFQPGGFRVHAMPDSILDQDVRCRFHGWSEDPAFELYTDLSPASREQILSYSDSRLGTDGSTLVPSSSTQSPRHSGRPTRIAVEFSIAARDGRTRELRIALPARESFWKYHLFGDYSRRPVQIVDSSNTDAPIEFLQLESSSVPCASSWISERPIPARQRAEQRIQLRDTETGRVLVKRLPNPDFRTIGREPLRSGGSALVVEAFIHP